MNLFSMSFDLASEAERDLEKAQGTLDGTQKLALAQIYATLSVSQEISKIWDDGLDVYRRDGERDTSDI